MESIIGLAVLGFFAIVIGEAANLGRPDGD
jgi:hypothetical protein